MKKEICSAVDRIAAELTAMSDSIFDHPEPGLQEAYASGLLCAYLEEHGFAVEKGVGGFATAFRATWENGKGGPAVGLLCEYDALEKVGHACGHHTQGPCIIGAAIALKDTAGEEPFKVVVYGTPAEETVGGKVAMLENGCFRDIDVALMMHLGDVTCVDVRSRALDEFEVTYHGVSAHAAKEPEDGRSAFDAILLSFNGIEFLREHVRDDIRIHYTVLDAGGPANVVPAQATAYYVLRSYDGGYLAEVVKRFCNILQGAALMTDTTLEVKHVTHFESKVPVFALNDLLMKNAQLVGAPGITPPREKTGSTDFANVMNLVPGSCMRMKFVPLGTAAHSQDYIDAGKSNEAHDALLYGAKILALSSADMISDPALMREIQEEFKVNLAAARRGEPVESR